MNKSFRTKISVILSLVMLLSMFTPVFAASQFSDTTDHWAEKTIVKWTNAGVIAGNADKFNPDEAITRAQFAQMVDNIFKFQTPSTTPEFKDVEKSSSYYSVLMRIAGAGVMIGADGNARPNDTLTRAEGATILARAFKLEDSKVTKTSFKDNNDIPTWAIPAIAAMFDHSYVKGMPDGNFYPDKTFTRAEAITIIDNMIAKLVTTQPAQVAEREYVNGNLLINKSGITLTNVEVRGNIYIAPGVGEGDVTLDNVKANDIYVMGGGSNSINVLANCSLDRAFMHKSGGHFNWSGTKSLDMYIYVLKADLSGNFLAYNCYTGTGVPELTMRSGNSTIFAGAMAINVKDNKNRNRTVSANQLLYIRNGQIPDASDPANVNSGNSYYYNLEGNYTGNRLVNENTYQGPGTVQPQVNAPAGSPWTGGPIAKGTTAFDDAVVVLKTGGDPLTIIIPNLDLYIKVESDGDGYNPTSTITDLAGLLKAGEKSLVGGIKEVLKRLDYTDAEIAGLKITITQSLLNLGKYTIQIEIGSKFEYVTVLLNFVDEKRFDALDVLEKQVDAILNDPKSAGKYTQGTLDYLWGARNLNQKTDIQIRQKIEALQEALGTLLPILGPMKAMYDGITTAPVKQHWKSRD